MLTQLDIPKRPGQSIAMDFLNIQCQSIDPVTHLMCDSLMVINCRQAKLAVVIPTQKTITAKDTAQLFIHHWYRRFGIPDEIVSDRDPKFISEYWTHFTKELGIVQKLSSSYHPQTDGSTERINRSILQMLRAELIRKPHKEWANKIPEIEFNYNARHHDSIGMAPFQAMYGFIPSFGEYQGWNKRQSITDRLDQTMTTTKRKRAQQETQYNK